MRVEKCGLRAWRAGKSPCGLAGLRARARLVYIPRAHTEEGRGGINIGYFDPEQY